MAEILSREECELVVERRLGNKNFDILHYAVNRLTTTGGFLGQHFIVDIIVQLLDNVSSENILHFFLKTKPDLEGFPREWSEKMNAFETEVLTLSKIFSKVRSSLNENGKNMTWTCECYYTRQDAIVLEDLSQHNFRSFTQRDTLQFEHFELTLKALANMHAASVIYEDKQPNQPYNLLDDYPDVLKETSFVDVPYHPGRRGMDCSVKGVWFLVQLMYGKDTLEKLKSKLKKYMLSIYDLQKPSLIFRNVICHGDLKRDNILFCHEGNKPVDVRIVDYQFARYAPPANDVMCFLHLASNRKFRRQYADKLLSVYYDHFEKNILEHGLNPNKLLPREQFKKSCDVYRKLGIIIAAVYCPGTYIQGGKISHVFESSQEFERYFMIDRTPEIIDSYNTDDFYKKNMEELIDELIEECTSM